MTKKATSVAARYGKKVDEKQLELFDEPKLVVNAFTNPYYPIVSSDPLLRIEHWGLIPHWVKTAEDAERIRRMTYNARSETVFDLPSFRYSIIHKRCLIPSTGYYEYHHLDKKKTQPYYLFLPKEEIFSIAGLFDSWTNPETGEELNTFSMLTRSANDLAGKIHNGGSNPERMPVILSREDEAKWIDPNLTREQIQEILNKPVPDEWIEAYVVAPDLLRGKKPKEGNEDDKNTKGSR